jgi:hypothetical protein
LCTNMARRLKKDELSGQIPSSKAPLRGLLNSKIY